MDASNVLDELVKATSSCCRCFCKSEEWSSVEVNEVKNELEKASEKVDMNGSKVYVIEDQSEREISNEVVLKYIGSMIYDNLIDLDSRDGDKIDTGYPLKYFAEIVKYMKNEYDIKKLNGVEFAEFCRELISLNIPLRSDITKRFFSQFSEYGDRWKNRCVVVNGNEYKLIMSYMKLKLGDLQYNSEKDRYEIIRNTTIPSANEILTDFENYLKAPSKYVKNEELKICNIMKLFSENITIQPFLESRRSLYECMDIHHVHPSLEAVDHTGLHHNLLEFPPTIDTLLAASLAVEAVTYTYIHKALVDVCKLCTTHNHVEPKQIVLQQEKSLIATSLHEG